MLREWQTVALAHTITVTNTRHIKKADKRNKTLFVVQMGALCPKLFLDRLNRYCVYMNQ